MDLSDDVGRAPGVVSHKSTGIDFDNNAVFQYPKSSVTVSEVRPLTRIAYKVACYYLTLTLISTNTNKR